MLSVPQTDLSEAEVEKLDDFLNDQGGPEGPHRHVYLLPPA